MSKSNLATLPIFSTEQSITLIRQTWTNLHTLELKNKSIYKCLVVQKNHLGKRIYISYSIIFNKNISILKIYLTIFLVFLNFLTAPHLWHSVLRAKFMFPQLKRRLLSIFKNTKKSNMCTYMIKLTKYYNLLQISFMLALKCRYLKN